MKNLPSSLAALCFLLFTSSCGNDGPSQEEIAEARDAAEQVAEEERLAAKKAAEEERLAAEKAAEDERQASEDQLAEKFQTCIDAGDLEGAHQALEGLRPIITEDQWSQLKGYLATLEEKRELELTEAMQACIRANDLAGAQRIATQLRRLCNDDELAILDDIIAGLEKKAASQEEASEIMKRVNARLEKVAAAMGRDKDQCTEAIDRYKATPSNAAKLDAAQETKAYLDSLRTEVNWLVDRSNELLALEATTEFDALTSHINSMKESYEVSEAYYSVFLKD